MGRYIKQNENRSELQQRIAADLRAKSAAKHKQDLDDFNNTTQRDYLKGSKQTTSLAWLWALVAVAIALVFIVFVYLAMTTPSQV